MSVGWLLGSSATQTRQFANEHGSAAAPAPGVAGGRGEPRWAAWLGGRLARSCPAPPPGHHHPCATGFVTGTAGTPGCTPTALRSRAGSAPGTWSFTKNATRKSKMKRKDRHPLLAFTWVCRPLFCIFRSY